MIDTMEVLEKFEHNGPLSLPRPDLRMPEGWHLSLLAADERLHHHSLSPDGAQVAFIWNRGQSSPQGAPVVVGRASALLAGWTVAGVYPGGSCSCDAGCRRRAKEGQRLYRRRRFAGLDARLAPDDHRGGAR